MNDERDDDLLERLRRANPVPAGTTAGRRQAPDADTLLADIVRARPRPRRAVLIAAAILIALLILAALAGFFLRHTRDPDTPGAVACYPTAKVDPKLVVGGSAGADPRATCAEYWRLGDLGPGPPPDFAVCVLPNGTQAVFPGESGTTCERLGLDVAGSGRHEEAVFSNELARAIEQKCFDEAGARAVIRDRLAAHNFSDWEVSVAPDHPISDAEPCASVSIDTSARKVVITAITDPHAPVTQGEP